MGSFLDTYVSKIKTMKTRSTEIQKKEGLIYERIFGQ